jgi:hypothetical protein
MKGICNGQSEALGRSAMAATSMGGGHHPTGGGLSGLTPEARAVRLMTACKEGKLKQVQALFDAGASVRNRDSTGWSPLLWASLGGFHRVVEFLLAQGAAEDWRVENGRVGGGAPPTPGGDDSVPQTPAPATSSRPVNSPLHWAVFRGHLRVVWVLLRNGFSVMDVDEEGNTALHLAAMHGDLEMVRTVMMAGVQVRQLNLAGNDPLAVASTEAARELIKRAAEQRICPGSKEEFGPQLPQYLCFSSGQFFSDEASGQFDMVAFPDKLLVTRPVRLGNKRSYEVHDAETALLGCLTKHVSMPKEDLRGPKYWFTEEESEEGEMLSPREDVEEGGDFEGLNEEGEEEDVTERLDSPSGAMPPRKGLKLGVESIVEEGDEDEEEEDEEEDSAPRRPPPKPIAPALHVVGEGEGEEEEEGRVEAGGISVRDLDALVDDDPAAEDGALTRPDQDECLGPDDLEHLTKTMEVVQSLNGSVVLLSRAQRALQRLKLWGAAQEAARAVDAKRPVRSLAELRPLEAAIARAAAAGVGDRLGTVRDVYRTVKTERQLRDMEEVCSRIPLASHDFDDDMNRLSLLLSSLETLDGSSKCIPSAKVLATRLGTEVGVSDSLDELHKALSSAEKVFEDLREEDPTVYPLPEPTPEEIAAKEAEEAAKAAAAAAAAKKPKGKAPVEEAPPEEPLPPLYPSPQLLGVREVDSKVDALLSAVGRARDAGADEALMKSAEEEGATVRERRDALWEDEIARIRVFEAERIKREKKNKKKGGKKKKK